MEFWGIRLRSGRVGPDPNPTKSDPWTALEGSVSQGQQDSSFICKEFKMMPTDGSVDDAHTILLGVEELNHFPPDFKEYIQKERLNCSRIDGNPDFIGRVFWSQLDNFADLIRNALQKLTSKDKLRDSLVQFWAATKTSEGRTLLTTQFQPFALGATSTYSRERLCEYRMGMCREYNNSFYADAECAQEQLGLPGRVFLSKLPEHAPGVEFYTLKEYPQRHLALRCEILFSWALPVFEQSSHTCVGVLEIAYHNFDYCPWADKEFLGRMYDIFQEFGLRCFDGYKHYKIQDGDKNKALTTAFQELDMVYESLCKIHDLTLALTWVSCRSCNHLLQSQFLTYCFEEDYDKYSFFLEKFKQVSKVSHLRKGQVAGRTLSFPNLLCCSDVKQFHIDEFPLVPFARGCELGGWFAMCLQSSYTGDELFILEFFLSRSTENDENILTKLRLILGTMEENFKTFKLASGQELGEALSVEVIDFQNGLKSHSIQMIPATRCIPGLELLQDVGVMLQQVQLDQPSMDAINNGMHVVSETQNYNLPSLDSLQNGKVTTQVDSSDQQSMDPSGQGLGEALSIEVSDFQNGQKSHSIQVPATRCIPGLELLQDGGVMLQQDLQDQPSMDVINSGMYVVSEAQNYNLPILDSLQNGKVTTQVDSSDQQSMDPSNKGQNAVTVERNILVVSSSKKGKRKTQDEEHKKAGVRIEVPLEKILKCSEMRRKDAAKVLKVSTSTLKRVCRDFGINRWPPRNIEDGSYQPLPVENLGQTPQLNYDLPSNQASASVAHLKPSFQDANMVTIRAMFENNVIKFRLSLSATLVEMQQEVAKRLNLEGGTYYIKYTDEEGLLILIACDEDLQYYLHACRSLGISSIAIQLEQK